MSIDIFGRSKIRPKEGRRGAAGIGFKLTADHHYDIQAKRLTNVLSGTNEFDAVNKQYVDTIVLYIDSLKARIDSIDTKFDNSSKYIEKFDRWVLEHDAAINFMETEGFLLKFKNSVERINDIAEDFISFKATTTNTLNSLSNTINSINNKITKIEKSASKSTSKSTSKSNNVKKGDSGRNT